MSARHVPLGAMYRWISSSLRLLFAHPATLLGAGALMIGVFVLMMLPSFLLMGPMMAVAPAKAPTTFAEIGFGRIGAVYGLMLVLNLAVMPPLVIGWMRLLRRLDQGQAASAFDLVAPFRDGAAWGRGIGYTLLVMLVGLLLLGVFVAALWTPVTTFIAQTTASQAAVAAGLPPPPVQFPASLGLGYFLFLFLMLYFQLAYFVGFAELALRESSATAALGRALAGVGRNALRLLAWAVSLMLAGFVVMLVVALVLGVLFAGLALAGPKVMMVAGVAFMLLFYVPLLLVLYPLMHAVTYRAWMDMLGDGAAPGMDVPEPLAA